MATKNVDPIHQCFAIIFSNVPTHYTVKDIILNHLHSQNRSPKQEITRLDRWKRILHTIKIEPTDNGHIATVIFSSIFYWCKYARLIETRERRLSVAIYPKYFDTIERIRTMDLISSNANNVNVNLYDIPSTIVSYSFVHNNSIYLCTKLQNERELLVKIAANNVSNADITEKCTNSEQKQKYDSELVLSLNKPCELYEYYQHNKIWKCVHCKYVNHISETESNKLCECCGQKRSENMHGLRELFHSFIVTEKPDLNVSKFMFTQQNHFYRRISAFDTKNKMFYVLSPVMNVLDNELRDIKSCLMFANVIKCTYKTLYSLNDGLKENISKMDIALVKNEIECKYLDFELLKRELINTLAWVNGRDWKLLLWPVLARITDFKNPGFLCRNLKEYTDEIADICEEFASQWLMKEALMSLTSLDSEALRSTVESLEETYQSKGVFDIDDEAAKGPFIWNLKLSAFGLSIEELSEDRVDALNKHKQWTELERVSNDNYLISFPINETRNASVYDFINLKQRLHINGYYLVNDKERNEIMHFSRNCARGEYMQYSATILTRPLNEERFLDEWKDKCEINTFDTEDCDVFNDSKFVIDNSDVYEPPKKKRKTNTNTKTDTMDINMDSSLDRIPKKNMEIINSKPIQMPAMDIDQSTQITINSRKRKRAEIIESPPLSPSPTPEPISFTHYQTRQKLPPKPAKPTDIESDSYSETVCESDSDTSINEILPKSFSHNTQTCAALEIRDNIGYAYGVPIFNEYYRDCADFPIGIKFPMQDFARLCLNFAVKSDLESTRDLRQIRSRNGQPQMRQRVVIKKDEASAQFDKAVHDTRYKKLWAECFGFGKDERPEFDIDLRDYCDRKKLKLRNERPFVMWEYGYFILEGMQYRLYLLMRLCERHVTIGVVQRLKPPWYEDCEIICEGLIKQIMAIDLSNVESGDEEEMDSDVDMRDRKKRNRVVRVKREFMYDGEDDSEYE